jgi:hypothetical protein
MEYTIRDRGREIGSFSLEQIEAKLDDHQIGMMAEVYNGEKWITIAELIEDLEEVDRCKAENMEKERNQMSERLALEKEAKAQHHGEEQEKRLLELEIQKQRTRQMEVELQREAPLLEQKSNLSETGSVHKFNGACIAGYVCVAISILLACIFWVSIIFGFSLTIHISFWVGVAIGSGGFILGITNCFLSKASRMHGVFQTLGSVISLLLLVIPFIFLEILIAKFT